MDARHIPRGLTKVAAELEAVDKQAATAVPMGRAAGYGALAGVGLHAGRKLMNASTGMPDDPSETTAGEAGKAAAGGAAIAGLLNLLNRITSKKR